MPDTNAPVIVHLVHGTWGNLPGFGRSRAVRWYKRGHSFHDRLEQELRDRATITAFDWGWGANLQGARVRAARRLKEEILSSHESTRHVLIGHSHGGNICMQVCADPCVARRVAAIITLATPFLVFRKAQDIRVLAASGLLMLSAAVIQLFQWIGASEVYSAVATTLFALVVGLNVFWIAAVLKAGDFESLDVELPKTLPCHVLIFRPAGDEASGLLSVVAPLNWFVLRMNKLASAIVEAVGNRYFLFILGFIAVLILYDELGRRYPLDAYQQWINVGLWSVGILLALPFGMAFLLICALRLPFGWDLGIRGFGYSVSSEASPPGEWKIDLCESAGAERVVSAHSGIYDQRAVQNKIVSFLRDAI